MSKDYKPSSFANLKTWLEGLKAGITSDGAACGQSPAAMAADTALIDKMLGPVTDAITKETAALEAHGTAQTALTDNNPGLRDTVNRYKTATGWTAGMAAAWGVNTSSASYDMNTHAPRITARAVPGKVEIKGQKPGFTSVTIQMRVEGGSWLDIGVKLNHFPFYDTTAPKTPGTPEKREYRALGYDGDQQVGQASDIVTAVFTS